MGTQKETRFKRRVLKKLRERGAWVEKIQQRAIRGTPDLLGCWAGRFFALELKASESEKADPLQKHKLEEIREAGGLADTVHPKNLEEVIDRWQELLGDTPPKSS